VQHATDNRQRGEDNRQRAIDSRQQGKKETGGLRHAADTAQKTESSGQRIQRNTCNRQQTACKRTRAHARCNRRHTALPHFVCGGQRAAENQQHARSTLYATASTQHGTDATQDATHDHTTRAAACTKHKRNRQHAAGNAMYEMRRTQSGRSRTSGHAAPAVVESDGLLDSDCPRVTSRSSRATRKTGHSGTAEPTARSPMSQTLDVGDAGRD
jgi:hypothetical protein